MYPIIFSTNLSTCLLYFLWKYSSYLVSSFYLEGIISAQIGGNYFFFSLIGITNLERRIFHITLPNELLTVVNLTHHPRVLNEETKSSDEVDH